MKYAVIGISGTQYKVEENQIITVDKLDPAIKSTTEVYLIVDDKKIEVGSPTVKNASVDFELVKNYQGPKLDVTKFRAKSRYRKHIGFRPQLTNIKITKINLG
jgi:large subunit ribosomal protein L21